MPAPASRSAVREPSLIVRLLGVPSWQIAERAPVKLSAKDAALIAKLVLDGPQPRLALCEMFWPASSAEQAADSLRQRASRLRAAAGAAFIEIGASVRVSPALRVDLDELAALSDAELVAVPGLLAGIDLGDHGDLDRWIDHARERVAERCAKVATDRAEKLEREGRLHEAIALASRVVEWLPMVEQGWRRLMRLHYLRGDPSAAADAYWRLHALLRDELGARPSAETRSLLQTIETAERSPPLPRRPLPVSLLRPPVLVGRHAAWAAMAAAWQVPQPWLLVGEAGLGKTRLLEDFVHGQDGIVLERARPGEDQAAHALLGRLLLRIDEGFAPASSNAVRCELARLRPEFGLPPKAPPHAEVLRRAIEQWLAAALKAGLRAIVVDDLHNTDQASLATLRWLAASPALGGLGMALASRPWSNEGAGNVLTAWLADSHRPARIDLQPLSKAELAQLLGSLALPVLLDEALVAKLFRHAGGHPLYTLATLQHLVATDAPWQDAQTMEPPDSIQALLDDRLRRLPAHARPLLQVAAVGGTDLTVERAARVLERAPLELSEAWAALEAHDVLKGEAFSHDLVLEAAMRAVPLGLRQSLHRQWAALLEADADALPARVAQHWEKGLRWSQAGHAWHRTAAAARLAGQLDEQGRLFEHAARCHALAGDRAARFDALFARLEGLHLQHGGSAVLDALPDVEQLAQTPIEQLRCRIERTEALLEQGRSSEAADEAARALASSDPHAEFAIKARAQLAKALAQGEHAADARVHAERALEDARSTRSPRLVLEAANASMFVHWSAGRLTEAIAVQREELRCAEAIGDQALAAASEGSLAALLAAVGDIGSTYTHALGARKRQRDVGLADNSTQLILNQAILAAAAAALGHFEEALDAGQLAVSMAGPDSAPVMRAKAIITLASVWMTLGQASMAGALLVDMPVDIGPGMRMQWVWMQARACEIEGRPAHEHWTCFDRLAREHPDLPFPQRVAFEASYRDEGLRAIEQLVRWQREYAAAGMFGVARALAWRELARRLDVPGAEATAAALERARELEPHAESGLSARCYPPQTWLDIARAYERAGLVEHSAACLEHGRRWVRAAMARMAPQRRSTFADANPVNRSLLST